MKLFGTGESPKIVSDNILSLLCINTLCNLLSIADNEYHEHIA